MFLFPRVDATPSIGSVVGDAIIGGLLSLKRGDWLSVERSNSAIAALNALDIMGRLLTVDDHGAS